MSDETAEPIRLTEGTKCPYCPHGVFQLHTRVTLDAYGREVQRWWLRCSHYHYGRTSYAYDLDDLLLGDTGYWAVVNGRVRIVKGEGT